MKIAFINTDMGGYQGLYGHVMENVGERVCFQAQDMVLLV